MEGRKISYLALLILAVLAIISAAYIGLQNGKRLEVIFFDVGQGDAVLISQGANQILIDGGADPQKALEKIGQHVPFWDRRIEVVLSTHPDQDHIGGLVGILKNYEVGKMIDSPAASDSQVYKNYAELASSNKIERLTGARGLKIKLSDADLEILYPFGPATGEKDTNAASLVAKLNHGKNSFLFTGDLPSEKEILMAEADLSALILKVAHHGSAYSTSEEFIKKVNPRAAVISVGASNKYGHPSPETIGRLKKMGAEILRTDESGDIKYVCLDPQSACELGLP